MASRLGALIALPLGVDPQGLFEDLLAEARRVGGNVVVDVQTRQSEGFGFLPLLYYQCTEAVGTAAVVDGGRG